MYFPKHSDSFEKCLSLSNITSSVKVILSVIYMTSVSGYGARKPIKPETTEKSPLLSPLLTASCLLTTTIYDAPRRPSTIQNFKMPLSTTVSLPAELYYHIFRYASRRDLAVLAHTAKIFQRPAEAALYHSITLCSRSDVVFFYNLVSHELPRIGTLVREFTLEWPVSCGEVDDLYRSSIEFRESYWNKIRDTLECLTGLEELTFDDGRDHFLSWILKNMRSTRLRVIRCGFVMDDIFLQVLSTQVSLEELSWTGSLISLPPNVSKQPVEYAGEVGHEDRPMSSPLDAELSIVASLRAHLPHNCLTKLKILHTESIALARTLVPGRHITHLWVSGASFASAYTSDYVYAHIPVPVSIISPRAGTYSQVSRAGNEEEGVNAWSHIYSVNNNSSKNMSDVDLVEQLCSAIHTFKESSGPIISLRISLGLSGKALNDVLSCISQDLPNIRALGFVPSSGFNVRIHRNYLPMKSTFLYLNLLSESQ